MKISDIKSNPNNPRVIKDDKFEKLVKSIQEFPKMMELRPMVINADNIVLGGNMRLKALKHLGYKEVPDSWVKRADELTEDEQRRFIISDNVGFGEHDWEMLKTEWDVDELSDWGIDHDWNDAEKDDKYTKKIDTPVYEAKNEKPQISELYNADRYKDLISEIENSSVDNDIKDLLKIAASRHIVFNYENMADFYASSEKEVQTLMENSALVIIDFEKAIELGYVKLSDEILSQYEHE